MKKTEEDGIFYCQETPIIEAIDLNTVECVIGRARDGNRWGIMDRNDTITEIEC
jgi:hypothetical protein